MIRTNSFTIKICLSLSLIALSIFLFAESYKEFIKISKDNSFKYDDTNINYFDKDTFQKYYEEIQIQKLYDPIFDEKKSKNYFKDIALDNLKSLFDDSEENAEELITKKTIDKNFKTDDEKDEGLEKKYSHINVSKGDNFAKILYKGGLRGRDIDELIINGKEIYDFSKIYLGDVVKIFSEYEKKQLKKFELLYRFSKTEELIVKFIDGKYFYEIRHIPTTQERIFISGIIETSLYEAMKNKGLSELIITEIIRVYSFDVDFQRDIYKGDEFEVLFSRKRNEEGEIVAIEDPEYLMLSSRGTPLTYYLYSNDEFSEYFDENGKGMTKSLMKTPINGARLSSSYGMRKHPILGYNKMHKGVDFAAPTGTPIFAAGNGVIEFVGRNGGYGKYIRIRHDGTYKTAYAHLSSYKKGISSGVRVKQGDIIGYVGSTGRSTGPHLHYEIIVNGQQVNPSTLKLPSGRKLNESQLNDFKIIFENKNKEIELFRNSN